MRPPQPRDVGSCRNLLFAWTMKPYKARHCESQGGVVYCWICRLNLFASTTDRVMLTWRFCDLQSAGLEVV